MNIRELLSAALFGAVVALIIYAASQTVAYRPFLSIQNAIDDSHFYRRFKLMGSQGLDTDRIVIIDIDDRSIGKLGRFKYWPRRLFAQVIGNLKSDGARLTFLDVILMEGGFHRDNKCLADSVRSAGNVMSGYYFDLDAPSVRHRPLDPVFNERMSSGVLYPETINGNHYLKAKQINLPFAGLALSLEGMGFTNYIPDPDSVIRHIPLYISYGKLLYPSAALQMWMHLNDMRRSKVKISPRGLQFGDTSIPTDKHCFMRVNYTGHHPAFPIISFVDVLNGDYEPGTFHGKIVMIGSSSEKLHDIKRVPCCSSFPGVDIHASALTTLLSKRFISVASGNMIFVMTIVCGIMSSVLFSIASPLKVGIPVVIGAPFLMYIFALFSFIYQSRLVNISLPSFVMILLYIVITIYRLVEKYETGHTETVDPELTT
ncbi:CHASE2 domain-containing protein [Candidatus Omnitrophota bacterium]